MGLKQKTEKKTEKRKKRDRKLVTTMDREIGPGGFACATAGGVAVHSWPLLLPAFGLSSLISLFLFRPLLLTHFGGSPEAEHLFPPIFWHN